MRTANRIFFVLGATGLLLSAGCPLQTVQIVKPFTDSLVDDPAFLVDVMVGRNFVQTATVVRVDGVDLIAALGLVPPFAGASGSVTIGTDLVAVTNFSYTIPVATDPIRLTATLTGLSAGDHTLEAEAPPSGGGASTIRNNLFAVVEPFTQELEVIAAAGTPRPGVITGGNHAGNVTLGESLAAPPVGLANGGQVSAGFVPSARGRSAGP